MALGDILSGITVDVGESCGSLNLKAGVFDKLYLFNFSQKGVALEDPTNPLLLTDLTLAAGGARAYVFEGLNSSIKPSYTLTPKTYVKLFTHAVNFRVFSHDPADEKTLADLFCAKVIAIVETKTRHFKMYGWTAGLDANEGSLDHAADDEAGAHVINLASKEGDEEPSLPHTIFDTDYATTKALVESLLVPTA